MRIKRRMIAFAAATAVALAGFNGLAPITTNAAEAAGGDFGVTTGQISPNLFGAVHYPSLTPASVDPDIGAQPAAWDLITDTMGVTFMRADARLQEILPLTVKKPGTNWSGEREPYLVTAPDGSKVGFTLAGYQADLAKFKATGTYLNGLSNPENWNTGRLLRWVKEADRRGFKVMVMSFQTPEWLGVPVSGTDAWGNPISTVNTAPQDWAVFRDIMGKLYQLVRPYADSYEFLNEPGGYVYPGTAARPDGGSYGGSQDLYAADYMYQSIEAMYAMEKAISGADRPRLELGGGSDDKWNSTYGVLGTVFSEQFRAQWSRIDFVSIHKYSWRPANPDDNPSPQNNASGNLRNLKRWLRMTAGRSLPVYLNEWNLSPGNPATPSDQVGGPGSVPFQGRNFIDLMRDQAEGAAYYTFYPGDIPMDDYEASKGWVETGHGAYVWNNGKPELRRFGQLWSLLSKQLGLGSAKSTMHKRATPADMDGVTFTNADSKPGAFLLNWNARSRQLDFAATNLPYPDGNVEVTMWTYDGVASTLPAPTKLTVAVLGGRATVPVNLPANSVSAFLIGNGASPVLPASYEFESYANTFAASAKIIEAAGASNTRAVTELTTANPASAVTIPVETAQAGSYAVKLTYQSSAATSVSIKCGSGASWTASLPATGSGFGSSTIGSGDQCRLAQGKSELSLSADSQSFAADSMELQLLPSDPATPSPTPGQPTVTVTAPPVTTTVTATVTPPPVTTTVTAPPVTTTVTATVTPPPVTTTVTSPAVTNTPKVTPSKPGRPFSVYEVPGLHLINGRSWFTECEPYSSAITRCRTKLWATTVKLINGVYVQQVGWQFNNLTYLPVPRAAWGNNPLAKTGAWTSNGTSWYTECDTAVTGRNACRSYVNATVIEASKAASGAWVFKPVSKWVVNNIVLFSS